MKAWQVMHYGEPDEMVLGDVPTPTPGKGEVLIRNRAAGLNFFDILQVQGKYQAKPEFPFTIGGEMAGVVEAVGEAVENVAAGDKVLATGGGGGYAEYAVAAAQRTVPIPRGMSFTEAAGFPIVYQTSYLALAGRGRLQAGEWLLVHAGASGVGMSAIQLGKVFGARIIATAGSDEKLAFCKDQGAEFAINYRDGDWVDEVKRITEGHGADMIYDPVGGDVFDLSSKCIAHHGRLLVIGFAGGRIPSIAANRLLLKNMSAVGVFWGRECSEDPSYHGKTHAALSALYEQGKIRPAVAAEFPLEKAVEALKMLADRKAAGKVVLTMA